MWTKMGLRSNSRIGRNGGLKQNVRHDGVLHVTTIVREHFGLMIQAFRQELFCWIGCHYEKKKE